MKSIKESIIKLLLGAISVTFCKRRREDILLIVMKKEVKGKQLNAIREQLSHMGNVILTCADGVDKIMAINTNILFPYGEKK